MLERQDGAIMRLRIFLIGAVMALAACGGGGGSPSLPSAGSNGSPAGSSPAASATPSPAPSPSGASATAVMTLHFAQTSRAAHGRRKPNFISPGSHSLKVTVNAVNGSAAPSWVSPNPDVVNLVTSGTGQNCTQSETDETCTVTIPAPPGSVNYTFDLFDGSNAAGSKVGTKTATFVLSQGKANSLSVGFQGIVSWVSFSAGTLAAATGTPGTSTNEQVNVTAYDADDYWINNNAGSTNYDNPIAVSVSDASAATSLSIGSTPSCPGSSSVTLNSPSDKLWLCYTGETTSGIALSASEASGGPASESITGNDSIDTSSNAIQLSGTTLCNASAGCGSGDANYDQQTVFLSLGGPSATFSASELGWTQSPYNQLFDLSLDSSSCGSGQSAVVTTSSSKATSWTISPQATGICKGTIAEHNSSGGFQTATVWFSVTSAQVGGY